MKRRVFITSMGANSAIGLNLEEQFHNLSKERSGLRNPQYLSTKHKNVFVGEVPKSDQELIASLGIRDEFVSRASLLALLASRDALEDVSLKPAKMGVFSGNTGGGMSLTEQHYASYFEEGTPSNIFKTLRNHHCADSTEIVSRELLDTGFSGTISTACSSSANTLLFAARLISLGHLDCALAGGTEALSLFTLNGFRSLKIMDDNLCRPFDQNRKGLNLGEGAAFLLLESEEHVERTGNKPICELTGWGNANDAFHETATSPQGIGATKAMELALGRSQLDASDITYINAHGTGTENNDQTEAQAINNIFGSKIPRMSSTKGFTGHTLGAAGALEACFSILAMKHQKVFGNVGLATIDENLNLRPERQTMDCSIDHVMSNSFGFGGNATSVIFSK